MNSILEDLKNSSGIYVITRESLEMILKDNATQRMNIPKGDRRIKAKRILNRSAKYHITNTMDATTTSSASSRDIPKIKSHIDIRFRFGLIEKQSRNNDEPRTILKSQLSELNSAENYGFNLHNSAEDYGFNLSNTSR